MQTNKQTNKGATKGATQATQANATSTAATLAAANAVPVTSAAAIKKPAVVYVNGLAAGAPANAPTVQIGGTVYNGALPASNPANRGVIGNVKNAANMLALGNGKGPKAGHNVQYFAAVQAAIVAGKGKATAAALATAAGAGGAAFVGYCVKNGWLATA